MVACKTPAKLLEDAQIRPDEAANNVAFSAAMGIACGRYSFRQTVDGPIDLIAEFF